MHEVNLSGVDLNLLVALDALLRERHVTRAARAIGLSQPATSHALARLRALTGDALLVRTPRGMVPTPRGEELAARVGRALAEVAAALAREAPFDPARARRTFVLATADYGELALLPRLAAIVAREAPHVDIAVRPPPDDPEPALESGAFDVVLTAQREPSPRLVSQKLFDERFVCALRRGHPALRARAPRLPLARFVGLAHVFIAVRGTPGGPVDDALAARGLARRIAVRVPHFLAAPLLVADSDYVLTAPERVLEKAKAAFDLELVDPPLPVPGFALHQAWHERRRDDAAHAWFRAAVARAAPRAA